MLMPTWSDTLRALAQAAEEAGVFAAVRTIGGRVDCEAAGSAAPAFYRVDVQTVAGAPAACVSLVTADRWLSQSIEQDLVHTGDKLHDLVDEELAELGYEGAVPRVEHYRSDDKLYTFRSPLAGPAESWPVAALLQHLLAYEAAFRHLGDMQGGGEE
jgi:hypothetical protein